MKKKQVDNDVAVIALAEALRKYDNCNPDIGMPPPWSWFVDEALEILGLDKTDITKICYTWDK